MVTFRDSAWLKLVWKGKAKSRCHQLLHSENFIRNKNLKKLKTRSDWLRLDLKPYGIQSLVLTLTSSCMVKSIIFGYPMIPSDMSWHVVTASITFPELQRANCTCWKTDPSAKASHAFIHDTLSLGGSKKGCRKVMSIYFPWFGWSLTFSVFGDHYSWQPWHLCSGVSGAKQRLRIQWRCCWHRRQHRQTRCQKHRSRRRPADSKSKCQNMSRHIPKQSKNMGGLSFLFCRQQFASGMPHPEMMVDDIAPALSFWCITTTIKCFMFPYVPTCSHSCCLTTHPQRVLKLF